MDMHIKIKWRKVWSQDLGEGLELGSVGIMINEQSRGCETVGLKTFDGKEKNSF